MWMEIILIITIVSAVLYVYFVERGYTKRREEYIKKHGVKKYKKALADEINNTWGVY